MKAMAYLEWDSSDGLALYRNLTLRSVPRQGEFIVDNAGDSHVIQETGYMFNGCVILRCDVEQSYGPWHDKSEVSKTQFFKDLSAYASENGWKIFTYPNWSVTKNSASDVVRALIALHR